MPTLDERWRALGGPWRPGMRVGYTFKDTPGIVFWDRVLDDCATLAKSNLNLEEDTDPAQVPNPISLVCFAQDDHGTLGTLLGLVRERYGDWSIVPVPGIGAWGLGRLCSGGLFSLGVAGATEAEVYIAALEALDAGS